ncbi:hypothetical protein [Symmachiella dynata]|uniref:hypothetical protein n=1 Tax=Symmachiella dynata TaxID=2527995 RepID=UPI0030EC4ACB
MRPPFTELIIKLVVLAIVLIPIGWAWWRRRQSRDENGRFSMMSDARNPGQPIASADRFEKVIGGSTFQCETHDGDADIPPYLVVTLEKEFNGDFSVTSVPNGEEPGWLKRHGITHVLSGD